MTRHSAPPERLRVSCAGLCAIRDREGRFLLGLNRARLQVERRVYTPLGGGIQYTDPSILRRFDAIPEDPATRDLRLLIAPDRLAAFRDWFLRREGRETTPFRELREELVDEFQVLPDLQPGDVRVVYRRTYEGRALSNRSPAGDVLTHYFHDIFDVTFVSPAVMDRLARLSLTSGLGWFTISDLERGVTADGAVVDGRALLDGTDGVAD